MLYYNATMSTEDIKSEFQYVAQNATHLDFLEPFLHPGDEIWVQPTTGFVTSSRKMSAKAVAQYWSDVIFPDSSEESYSASFPFAQSRLFYVMETIAQFLKLNDSSNLSWSDFATGEGVLLKLIRLHYPSIKLFGTEHSIKLVDSLRALDFNVKNMALGESQNREQLGDFDISTLTWTLANSIDPVALLSDVVKNTKIGGIVCIAESSRVLVPIRKSLNDYFSKTMPADLHPSNFSVNTLRCLMQICGLEISYVNRYFDSDVLLVIGRKTGNLHRPTFYDSSKMVYTFFRKWAEASIYYESLRENVFRN